MQQNNLTNTKLTIQDIALIGMMTATLEVGKQALAFLPNIEIVSLLIILYTLFFGKKTVFAILTFILIEGCLYGFGIWWVMYLYSWPLLSFVTALLKKHASPIVYALLSGIFGLSFGALCSIPYLFAGGWKAAFTWWVAGIPYDILHCIGNFVLCLVLFKPLHHILNIIKRQMFA